MCFTTDSDHKCLILIVSSKNLDNPLQIVHFQLWLTRHDYTIIYFLENFSTQLIHSLLRVPLHSRATKWTLLQEVVENFVDGMISTLSTTGQQWVNNHTAQMQDVTCKKVYMYLDRLDRENSTGERLGALLAWEKCTVTLQGSSPSLFTNCHPQVTERRHPAQWHEGIMRCSLWMRMTVQWPGVSKELVTNRWWIYALITPRLPHLYLTTPGNCRVKFVWAQGCEVSTSCWLTSALPSNCQIDQHHRIQ